MWTEAGLLVYNMLVALIRFKKSRDGHLQGLSQLLKRAHTGGGALVFDQAEGIDIQSALFRKSPDGKTAGTAQLAQALTDLNFAGGRAGGSGIIRWRNFLYAPFLFM